MTFSLQEIARITGGRLVPVDARVEIRSVSTDSRTLRAGELFVPLRGENFDGHDFLTLAVRNGAAACLSEDVISGMTVPVIVVNDTLKALGDLAAAVRGRFSGPVAAITGSSGKTTTKEMLAAILTRTAPGLVTAGNFNNLIGLPLTLLQHEEAQRWMVLEMGMSARGEIARLCEIASPTVGVITNVGAAHLETLHGIDGVARAKGELFEALGPGGSAVINADDPLVRALPVANGVRRLLFGLAPEAEVRAENVAMNDGRARFDLVLPDGRRTISLPVAGRHNISNGLAAAAVASVLGITADDIAGGLEGFSMCGGRMEVQSLANGMLLIDDSYNANPLSMAAALQALTDLAHGQRRIAVLGDMLELGDASEELHWQCGEIAAQKADHLLTVGALGAALAEGALQAGMPQQAVQACASHEELLTQLQALLRPGDRILVKGSRGMRMEKISNALRAGSGGTTAVRGA